MTREQLQERLTAYGPRATRVTLCVLGALLALSIAVLIAFVRAPRDGRIVWLSFFVLNSSIIFFGIGLAIRAARYRAIRLDLLCPRCGKAIAGKAAQAVLSTGRCPSCGFALVSNQSDFDGTV